MKKEINYTIDFTIEDSLWLTSQVYGLKIVNVRDYIRKVYGVTDEHDIDAFYEGYYDKCKFIQQLLTLEIAIFTFRRLGGTLSTGVPHNLNDIWNKLAIEFKNNFNETYVNANENIDW